MANVIPASNELFVCASYFNYCTATLTPNILCVSLELQAAQARERGRNRKLPSLFLSKKKWGSAEELAPIEEERSTPPQPLLPAYRPRKFSR